MVHLGRSRTQAVVMSTDYGLGTGPSRGPVPRSPFKTVT